MKFYNANQIYQTGNAQISLECPQCGHFGAFQGIGSDTGIKHEGRNLSFGQRKCPRPECKGHIFFVSDGNTLVHSYPPRLISFDTSNIPDKIIDSFTEALTCHANNCMKASAIMIRKTLEEICNDKKIKADNLFKRLEKLSNEIVLPKELKEGMQELRLLGNDAAHIEAKTFDEIGNIEIEISIEFTKEILKGIYQYESLLQRLKSLKKEKS